MEKTNTYKILQRNVAEIEAELSSIEELPENKAKIAWLFEQRDRLRTELNELKESLSNRVVSKNCVEVF